MARHGTAYLLCYRVSEKLVLVGKKFHRVKLTIIKNLREEMVTWIYSYLGSDYAEYSLKDNIHVFRNGGMQINVHPNVAYYITDETKLAVGLMVYMINLPYGVMDWWDNDMRDLRQELLPMNFNNPIDCYWRLVNFAKKHNLVAILNS